MNENPRKSYQTLAVEDGRYKAAAFQFLSEGLNYTVEKLKPKSADDCLTHVTGRQLCLGLLDLARKRWGLMAFFVLKYWNITETRDFGEIVFLLIENHDMRKQPTDNIDDFDEVFDFTIAFRTEYDFSAGT